MKIKTYGLIAVATFLSLMSLPASAESSAVNVTTDRPVYDSGQMIVVTIVNTLSAPVYALTGQTYCTIVTLQRSVDGEWKSEGPCQSYAPPGWVKIAAGDTSRIEVMPSVPADQPLPVGRYRAQLTLRVGSSSGQSATVFSPEFLISNR